MDRYLEFDPEYYGTTGGKYVEEEDFENEK